MGGCNTKIGPWHLERAKAVLERFTFVKTVGPPGVSFWDGRSGELGWNCKYKDGVKRRIGNYPNVSKLDTLAKVLLLNINRYDVQLFHHFASKQKDATQSRQIICQKPELLQECLGLTLNVAAASRQECQASCCESSFCDTWQMYESQCWI